MDRRHFLVTGTAAASFVALAPRPALAVLAPTASRGDAAPSAIFERIFQEQVATSPGFATHASRNLDYEFGFRPWDQHVRCDPEFAPVKLLAFGDVLSGLALEPLVQIPAVVDPFHLSQLALGMAVQVGPLAAERVRQQHLSRQTRCGNVAALQQLRALIERGLERHDGP